MGVEIDSRHAPSLQWIEDGSRKKSRLENPGLRIKHVKFDERWWQDRCKDAWDIAPWPRMPMYACESGLFRCTGSMAFPTAAKLVIAPVRAELPDLRLLVGKEVLLAIEVKTNARPTREQLDRYAAKSSNLALLTSLGHPEPEYIEAAIPDRRYPILLLEHIFAWINTGDPLGGREYPPPIGGRRLVSVLESAIDEVSVQMRDFVEDHRVHPSFPKWAENRSFDLEYFTKAVTDEFYCDPNPKTRPWLSAN